MTLKAKGHKRSTPKKQATSKNQFFKNTKLLIVGSLIILTTIVVGSQLHVSYNRGKHESQIQQLQAQEAEVLTTASTYIKKKEGFKANPYRCSAGAKTIGYGDTAYMKQFPNAKSITEVEASKRLNQKIQEYREVLKGYFVLVGNRKVSYAEALSASQQASIISFMYNLGDTAFRTSTLKTKIDHKISLEARLQKDYSKNPHYKKRLEKDLQYVDVLVKREFMKWSKIKSGKTYTKLASLSTRRGEEAKMFLASN